MQTCDVPLLEGPAALPCGLMHEASSVCDQARLHAGLTVFAIGPSTLAQGQTLVAQVWQFSILD